MADGEPTSETDDRTAPRLSRRTFVVGGLVGGTGVLLGLGYLGRNAARRAMFEALETTPPAFGGDTSDPWMWFEVTGDNRIRLLSPKVEMGQGTFTSLAQIAADELEVDVGRVEVLHATSAQGNIDTMSTGGSQSVAGLWMPLRELAATLREMLRQEAARRLEVEPGQLTLADGVFTTGDRSLTYGEVAAGQDAWTVPSTPTLKDVGRYRFVGRPVPRVDLEAKVFGDPIFGMDASMPEMVHASVVRPDRVGGTLASVDTSAAEAMPGVLRVVVEDDFVGVVAETRMQAERAKEAVRAEWRAEHAWQTRDIEELIRVGRGTPMEIQLAGDAKGLLDRAEQADDPSFLRAEFASPIGAHAQLEPNGALAHVDGDRVTVTMSTQVVRMTRDQVAERLGVPPENVTIRPTYLGGGFGRRLHTPNAMQAAVLSREVGRPVKCFFNRREEFQNDTFRPPTHHVLRAKLGDDGRIEAFEHNLSSGDVMFGSPLFAPYFEPLLVADFGALKGGMIHYRAIPNLRAVSWRVRLPFATSWWRSLGLLANTFAIESFMDELAERAGRGAVDFRLAHLDDDEAGRRMRGVIEAAAERAGYVDEPQGGRAMGIACSTDSTTTAAHVAEVSMEGDRIRVHKVTCAVDPGLAVNPDQVRAQCEGNVVMGLSAAMYERMEVVDGVLRPTLYGPYRMALLRDAPREIDVVLRDGTGVPGPVGEPPMGPIGAAIANAVARLTGERRRRLPLQA
ncbi:MAG: molybdopterin cofactor-binding domain-containing protein [Sandaracinaceae bacterium]